MREYEVEFTDGTREKYQANVIAENMYAQVDDEGLQYLLLQEITDHRKGNSAVPISEGTVRSANGTETQGDDARMGAISPMEGWFNQLGEAQGSEGIEPSRSCRVCSGESHSGRARICLVGTSYVAQAESDYFQGQELVLADDSQVWY